MTYPTTKVKDARDANPALDLLLSKKIDRTAKIISCIGNLKVYLSENNLRTKGTEANEPEGCIRSRANILRIVLVSMSASPPLQNDIFVFERQKTMFRCYLILPYLQR